MKETCDWPSGNEKMIEYHDTEWGVPVHDDIKHFEFLVLDAFQAGLSWSTILNKRENFRTAFDNFDIRKIASYDEEKIMKLLQNAGIVRNQLKIRATVNNAQRLLEMVDQYGSFDYYIWQFTGGKPKINSWNKLSDLPSRSTESDAMSKDLKNKGFKFVGSTICYAYMQAAGMVNDHMTHCHRYKEIIKMS